MGTRTLDMDKVLILIAAVYAAPFPEGDQAPYGQPPAPYGPQPRPYGPTQKYEPAPIPYKPAPAPYQPAPAPYKPAPAPYKPAPAPYKPEPAPVYKVEEEEEYAPQPYKYEYGVQDDYTNAAFAKSESQNEVGTVTGSYKVNLPDGRIQTVTYTADEVGGFKAEVTYEGTPIYPPEPKEGYGVYSGPGAFEPHTSPQYHAEPVYNSNPLPPQEYIPQEYVPDQVYRR